MIIAGTVGACIYMLIKLDEKEDGIFIQDYAEVDRQSELQLQR